MNTKEKIIQYIKEKYEPLSIVLHGSRANGAAREHSDWDFLVLTNKKTGRQRFIQFGENIEVKEVLIPVPDDKIDDTFGFFFRRENTEICYDPQNLVPGFLEKKEAMINQGNNFREDERLARFAFLKSFLNSIIDYGDMPLIVFSKKAEFYSAALFSWFRFLHKEFKPSDHIALLRIQAEDPEYYSLLLSFSAADNNQAVEIGDQIINKLFPDLWNK